MSNVVEYRGSAGVNAQTAVEVRAQVVRIQEVMTAVFKKDTHYGRIPGAGDKPVLFKAGAEVLCTTFRIAPEFKIDDLSTSDEIRYRVSCTGRHQQTGIALGEGVGEASTDEEKYKWRAAVCTEEFEATDLERRRVKYSKNKGSGGFYTTEQVRTNKADIANTVLKMACKRALVAMTLIVTSASDCFTQDLEDMPEEVRETVAAAEGTDEPTGKPTTEAPQARSGTGNLATEKQIKLITLKLNNADLSAATLCEHLGIESLTLLPFAKVNEALAFISSQAAK